MFGRDRGLPWMDVLLSPSLSLASAWHGSEPHLKVEQALSPPMRMLLDGFAPDSTEPDLSFVLVFFFCRVYFSDIDLSHHISYWEGILIEDAARHARRGTVYKGERHLGKPF